MGEASNGGSSRGGVFASGGAPSAAPSPSAIAPPLGSSTGPARRLHLFDQLKYLYVGSDDADRDIAHWRSLGVEPEWDYTDFGTRVAGFRTTGGPLWIVAGHRPPGILPVYTVADAETTKMNLEAMGWAPEEGPVEIPDGPCFIYRDPSGNRLAVVGEVRPEAEEHLRQGMTKEAHEAASAPPTRP